MSNKLDKNDVNIERGQRLKFVRYLAGMSGEQFAQRCQVARSTITGWERGTNGLTEQGATKVEFAMEQEGIDCAHLWLLHGIGKRPEIVDQTKLSRLHYPVLETEHQAAVREPLIEPTNESALEETKLFKRWNAMALVHTLQDGSMLPIYQPYDCLGGIKLHYPQFELAQGRICLVLLKANPTPLVRRVKLEGKPFDKVSLYVINAEASLNCPPLYQLSIDNVIALAPVTRLWRNLETH